MILIWIVWYWCILGFQVLIPKCTNAAELVEQIFIEGVSNEKINKDKYIKNEMITESPVRTKEGPVSKTILKQTGSLLQNWNNVDSASSNLEESSRFIVNPLIDSELGIQINLFISDVKSDSVKLSWKVNTFRRPINFGLKVSFRSFGSSIEREVIFLVENNKSLSDEVNYYEINGLTQNTGYVFCFYIIPEMSFNEVLDNEEYQQITTKRSKSTTLKETSTVTTLTSMVEEETVTYEPITYRDYDITMKTIARQEITTLKPDPVPNKKGSYAYTSTGELIFLPTSAWNPFRRKRNAPREEYGSTFQNSFRKESSNSNVQCTEIFTSKVSIFAAGKFVIAITTFAIAICVIILLLMVCCINKLFCKKSIVHSLKKLTFGLKHKTENESEEVDVSSAVTYVRDSSIGSRRDSLEESTDVESIKPSCSCKSSSLPSYHEILLRHELKEKMKGATFKKQKSTDIFHPGYAIPPSSTTDVYGYDIPKLSNKKLNVSNNDNIEMDDGFSWKDKEIYNWNCHAPRKKSVYTSKNVPRLQDIFSNMQLSSNPVADPYKIISDINDSNQNMSVNDSKHSCTPVDCTLGDVTKVTECSQKPSNSALYSHKKRKSSIGDITITGGTLIEVPEGYVVPDRSRGLSLVVTGTPVYL